MNPKVSIVVCCYNGEKYIPSCFQYILSQTYKNIEVLFVDDGSMDESYLLALKWSDKFASEGMTLCCYQQVNQGAGFAARTALLHATGDYILCFDIDDCLYPDSVEKQLLFLEANPSFNVVRTNGYEVLVNQQKILFVTNEKEKNAEDLFTMLVLGKTNNWAGSYMVRSSQLWRVFPDHRILGSRYGQNLQILLSAAYRSKCGFIDVPLMEYLRREDSFTKRDLSFERLYKLYNEFEGIRIDLMGHLKIPETNRLWNEMRLHYASLRKDLCIEYEKKDLFEREYGFLRRNKRISYLDSYYHYHFRGQKLRALYYRLLHRIVS